MRKIDWNEKTRMFFDELAQENGNEERLAAFVMLAYSVFRENLFQLLIRQGRVSE